MKRLEAKRNVDESCRYGSQGMREASSRMKLLLRLPRDPQFTSSPMQLSSRLCSLIGQACPVVVKGSLRLRFLPGSNEQDALIGGGRRRRSRPLGQVYEFVELSNAFLHHINIRAANVYFGFSAPTCRFQLVIFNLLLSTCHLHLVTFNLLLGTAQVVLRLILTVQLLSQLQMRD